MNETGTIHTTEYAKGTVNEHVEVVESVHVVDYRKLMDLLDNVIE